jgi:molecular chaperone DnaJ
MRERVASDYYGILGVARDASPEEIKRAYRRLARELHPDVNPDPVTQDKFKEVTSAYEVLSDPEKRRMFDLGGDPLSASGGQPGFGNFGFGDIMDAFFGQQTRGPRSRIRRGQDALIRIRLDLADAVHGVAREIAVDTAVACPTCHGAGTADDSAPSTCPMCHGRGDIQQVQKSFLGQVMTTRPCPQCQGFGTVITHPCPECSADGRVRTRRTLAVQVPPGVDTGTRIQLTGEGEIGPGAGPAGDLFVEIVVVPHPIYHREGDDLHCSLTLPMTAAALGTNVDLETFDGTETIDVKPGSQPGETITLRGKGVPRLRGGGRGHLLVHLDVQTPTKLDARQEELLRELSKLRSEEHPVVATGHEPVGFFSKVRDAFNGR